MAKSKNHTAHNQSYKGMFWIHVDRLTTFGKLGQNDSWVIAVLIDSNFLIILLSSAYSDHRNGIKRPKKKEIPSRVGVSSSLSLLRSFDREKG